MHVALCICHFFRSGTGAILVLGLALRIGVVVWRADQLTVDRDAYLGIAQNLVDGAGFCSPGSTLPTAFRPPLYPLLLASLMTALPAGWAVAVVNIAAGAITIWLVGRIGMALGLGAARHLAALLIAVDPLLLNATAQPMTEVVFAALTTAWLWSVTSPDDDPDRSLKRPVLIGVLFGLAALCRPTIWPLAGLMGVAWCAMLATNKEKPPAIGRGLRHCAGRLLPIVAGALAVVLPWVVRNQVVFGTPILMTTHGGYTLLLANNPIYDQEVVQQPWGTTWSGDSLSRWQSDLERRVEHDLGPQPGELARDAWMSAEAKAYIQRHPEAFFRATLHRIGSLWSVTPRGEGRALPTVIRMAVAAFYVAEYLATVIGLWWIVRRRELAKWLPCLLLILTIQGVHLVYWTDARMRTPLEPVLALLAARMADSRRRMADGQKEASQ